MLIKKRYQFMNDFNGVSRSHKQQIFVIWPSLCVECIIYETALGLQVNSPMSHVRESRPTVQQESAPEQNQWILQAAWYASPITTTAQTLINRLIGYSVTALVIRDECTSKLRQMVIKIKFQTIS